MINNTATIVPAMVFGWLFRENAWTEFASGHETQPLKFGSLKTITPTPIKWRDQPGFFRNRRSGNTSLTVWFYHGWAGRAVALEYRFNVRTGRLYHLEEQPERI
jgi:hypothetical protein